MGYTYALAKDGTVIGYGAQGYKRAPWEAVGGGLPMTPDTRLTLASVSKTITATAFMTLGVSADDNFYPYLAQRFPIHGQGVDQVKIADLLTHKSGLTRLGATGSCGSEFGMSFDAWIKFLISQRLVETPGVGPINYSNNNLCVVRALIETISGQDYVPYVNSHVFVPAGVLDMTPYPDPIDPTLYYLAPSGAIDQSPGFVWTEDWTSIVGPYGWYGSAIDIIRFLNGIRTFTLLTPERTDEMFNRLFGWQPVETAAGTAFWHPGIQFTSSGGTHTLLSRLPDGYDVTLLINTVDPDYVNQVVTPIPFTAYAGCCPTLDAAVDAFNFSWNEMQ